MAAAVLTFSSPIKSTHRSTNLYRARTALSLSRISWSSLSQRGPLDTRQVDLSRCYRSGGCNGPRLVSPDRRVPAFQPPAALEESNLSGIEVGKENELKIEVDESRKAWKQTLESFKEEARKMKDVSQEAYDLYSKRALVIFKRTSKALITQAEKARHDLTLIAKEINEEGQAYLLIAADSSPEPVKDIAETLFS
ncbi:hypothetical protein HPP92_007328 [Vanilla planifolia]|uniref:Uncharacterized protein n=2 Tax=Vanilla planifolia TaxID=51239 RepID=A0A835VB56_VANPL|nr:hypothetical protein HPP92_007328 [Vanilla planifolia]